MENQAGEPAPRPAETRPRPARGKALNLGNVVGDDDLELSVKTREHPDEREARLRREEADAAHQRRKDLLTLGAVLVSLSATTIVCMGVILWPGAAPDTVRWATTILTTIVSAGVGYMTGKSSK